MLMLSQLVSKIIAFFYTIFLAKELGVENFGLFIVALSYFSLISSVSEFGINRYATRELSIKRIQTSHLLCLVALTRMAITSVFFALFVLLLPHFDQDQLRSSLIILAVSAILPQSIAFTIDSAFIGLQKIGKSALGLLILNLATTLIGVYLVKNNLSVIGAVSSLVLGQIIYVFVLVGLSLNETLKFFKVGLDRKHTIYLSSVKDTLKNSLPYGILGMLGLIYFKIDAVLLGYLRGSYEAGIYGAAYRFLEAIVFIPSAIATTLFPVLARLHQGDMRHVKSLYRKSVLLLFIVSIFIYLLFITILPKLILFFLPQYPGSIDALMILSLTIPFMFIHVPGAIVVLSTDKYLKPVIFLSLLTVGFNLGANLIFIPKFGYMAASVITVLSEVLSFIVFFIFIQSFIFSKAKKI